MNALRRQTHTVSPRWLALSELGLRSEFGVQVQRLRVHGERGEKHVVHLRHRASARMMEDASDLELFVVQSGHGDLRARGSGAIRNRAQDQVEGVSVLPGCANLGHRCFTISRWLA